MRYDEVTYQDRNDIESILAEQAEDGIRVGFAEAFSEWLSSMNRDEYDEAKFARRMRELRDYCKSIVDQELESRRLPPADLGEAA